MAVYPTRFCIICEKKFDPINSNKLTCSNVCRAMQRKAVRNAWYKDNANRIYNRYKAYHLAHNAGRLVAERLIKRLGITKECQECGSIYKVEVHHRDQDTTNNKPENLALLCKNCHYQVHIKALVSKVSIADLETSPQTAVLESSHTC